MRISFFALWLIACAHAPSSKSAGGLGSHRRRVTTSSKIAQREFDRGLAFVYAFNHDEAIRRFSLAAQNDPGCAMCEWGVALANGPHINNPTMDVAHVNAAWAALERAKRQAEHASPVENALIEALSQRYADPTWAEQERNDRKTLDAAYATAMRRTWQTYSNDTDVGALFAEALMDLRPWDLWTADGKPQPETPEILATLERVLTLDPRHPLANHLYIHVVEGSPNPEKGDAAADRLRTLAPALGHLVHMPSHIDVRRGRWAQAEQTNERAIEADRRYRQSAPPQEFYRFYMVHNRHMLAYAALMQGESAKALTAIRDAAATLPPEALQGQPSMVDGYLAMPLEVLMRFGRWDEILATPDFDEKFPLARALRHCARGIARAAQGEPLKAREEEQAFALQRENVPKEENFGNNSAADLLSVAGALLAGEILVHENRMQAGIEKLTEAVQAEDALRYNEPPDWIQPVRHALGAALLKAGRAADAEAVYREDLRRLPENGWSLWGLSKSLRLQKKDAEAVSIDARFANVWKTADLKLSSSCFCLPGI